MTQRSVPHPPEESEQSSVPATLGDPQEQPKSDAKLSKHIAAEHPKGRRAPVPPDHPSHGMIDEGGKA
jgi:hypothetical protein